MTEVFSTITSPVFSELVIVLAEHITFLPRDATLFKTLCAMNEVWPFKLVLLFEVPGYPRREVLRGSEEEALELMIAEGTFDFLDSSPTIRIARSRHDRWARPLDLD